MERVRGFSPAQWAPGRARNWDQSFFVSGNETPDPSFLEHLQGMETGRDAWLKARYEERPKRASRARNRPLAHFRLGDEVVFCRRGKGSVARRHTKGRFHEGAVVLATSTEIGEEDGSRKPRKVVWITHGTLIKCAPEQLRYSSGRARQLANVGQAQKLPWTHEVLDGCAKDNMKPCRLMLHQRKTRQVTSQKDWMMIHHQCGSMRQDKSRENLEMQPSASSSVTRPRGEAVLSQTVENITTQAEQLVRKVSKSPTKSSKQESRAVFLSTDVTSGASQQKRFVNRRGQFN